MPKKREKHKNKENNMVQPPFQYECCNQHWKEFLLTSEWMLPQKQQTSQNNQQKYYKIELQLHGQYEAKHRQPQ